MKTIGIFKTSCPSGWTRMSAWDGKFLRGAATYGGTGGTTSHNHSINMPAKLSFGVWDPLVNPGNQNYGPEYFAHFYHEHTVDPASANTSTEEHIPEHMEVVFCYKED